MNVVSLMKSVERYDYRTNEWTKVADIKYMRSDGAVTTLNNQVVAVCRFDGRNVHSHGEIYDPIVNMWHPLSLSMKTRRTGCTAVPTIMDFVIVVLSGYNRAKRLDTSKMCDMREGIWLAPACRTETYQIYAAGGFDGQTTTRDNERFDMRNRKWQALPDMTEAKSALRLVQLSDHPFLDDLFQMPDDEVGLVTTW